jgi:hypothetical protein
MTFSELEQHLLETAAWSVQLSADRGLGNRDMVMQIVRHCALGAPPDSAIERATAAVVQLRSDEHQPAPMIAHGVLETLGLIRVPLPRPTAAAVAAAEQMIADLNGNMMLVGDTKIVDGWSVKTHTLGRRNAAGAPEDDWWDEHYRTLDQLRADGKSTIVGDPADGIFASLTPTSDAVSVPWQTF